MIWGEQNNKAYKISWCPHFFKLIKTIAKYKEPTDKVQWMHQKRVQKIFSVEDDTGACQMTVKQGKNSILK